MRIHLDGNASVSAMKSDRAEQRLLQILADSGDDVVADEYVMDESRRNLKAKFPTIAETKLSFIQVSQVPTYRDLPATSC